jgi:hypothetical protein
MQVICCVAIAVRVTVVSQRKAFTHSCSHLNHSLSRIVDVSAPAVCTPFTSPPQNSSRCVCIYVYMYVGRYVGIKQPDNVFIFFLFIVPCSFFGRICLQNIYNMFPSREYSGLIVGDYFISPDDSRWQVGDSTACITLYNIN